MKTKELTYFDLTFNVMYFHNSENNQFYAIEPYNRLKAKVLTAEFIELPLHQRQSAAQASNQVIHTSELLDYNPCEISKRHIDSFLTGFERILPSYGGLQTRYANFLEWKEIREKRNFDNTTLNNIISILKVFHDDLPHQWMQKSNLAFIRSTIQDTKRWMRQRKNKKLSIKQLKHSVRLMEDYSEYLTNQ